MLTQDTIRICVYGLMSEPPASIDYVERIREDRISKRAFKGERKETTHEEGPEQKWEDSIGVNSMLLINISKFRTRPLNQDN